MIKMESLTDEIITTSYENIETTLEKIPLDKKVGLIIIFNNVKYEFLIHIKSNNDELICLGPSGLPNPEYINRFKNKPMFTRHSWNFKQSVICYNDNTRYVWEGDVGSGWGIGLPEDYFLENIKDMIIRIARHYNILNENILFYGSSMGGFTSIQLATMIKNSYAIAENPQIDARNWMKSYYLKKGMYSELYDKNILNQMEEYRYNIVEMIKKENYIPNLTIIHDINPIDIQMHLNIFIQQLTQLPFKKEDFHKIKIIIEPLAKHTPIPLERIYEIFGIHKSIKQREFIDIDYDEVIKAIPLIKKSKLFNKRYYSKTYPEIKNMDGLTHYLLKGWKEGRNPSEKFDTNFYLNTYKGVKLFGKNPLVHYVLYGKNENKAINEKEFLIKLQKIIPLVENSGLFNEEYYKKQCSNLEGLTPIEHYLIRGWKNGKNPSKDFDNDFYLNSYDGVRQFGINPLIHYIKYGKEEKRTIKKVENEIK